MSPHQVAPLPPLSLKLWLDPLARDGYSNMAVDELLCLQPEAWLRVYSWAKPAVSYGYFDRQAVAAAIFPGDDVEYIRRWTGGGIVDHRSGLTYTLTLPSPEMGVYPTAGELYSWIHGALAKTLQAHGVDCHLLQSDSPDGGRACWASPVQSDIVDAAGQKLAGAGQRRYKGAVLHQGLIQCCEPSGAWPQSLAAALCDKVEFIVDESPFEGFDKQLKELLNRKYKSADWENEEHGRR